MSDMLTIRSTAKGIRLSPRKMGLVASLIRGRSVADALVILQHTPKRAALPVQKIITSAKANAVNNHKMKEDGLMITQLQVTAGPRLKRFKPAAMGRALPFQKKATHVLIEVTGELKPKKVAAEAKAAPKKEAK